MVSRCPWLGAALDGSGCKRIGWSSFLLSCRSKRGSWRLGGAVSSRVEAQVHPLLNRFVRPLRSLLVLQELEVCGPAGWQWHPTILARSLLANLVSSALQGHRPSLWRVVDRYAGADSVALFSAGPCKPATRSVLAAQPGIVCAATTVGQSHRRH